MFFFFKQKAAYEMRISDWSSDVCSSDLHQRDGRQPRGRAGLRPPGLPPAGPRPGEGDRLSIAGVRLASPAARRAGQGAVNCMPHACILIYNTSSLPVSMRSEEHTSELQSLMRISYAVFCLKKKTT